MAERQRLVSSEGWTVAVPRGPSLLRWGRHCPLLQIRREEGGWGGGGSGTMTGSLGRGRVWNRDGVPGEGKGVWNRDGVPGEGEGLQS